MRKLQSRGNKRIGNNTIIKKNLLGNFRAGFFIYWRFSIVGTAPSFLCMYARCNDLILFTPFLEIRECKTLKLQLQPQRFVVVGSCFRENEPDSILLQTIEWSFEFYVWFSRKEFCDR